ncbi:hypothetical protein ACIGCK_11715 [Microbacterium sp. NPDC078428]|uniref:hypothetical protein n=1 Tax=Microbacterium sp. NPDC078428 TaxID=3364190 RepID=UPI0037C9A893
MDQGAVTGVRERPRGRRHRSGLRRDVALMVVIGMLLVAALVAAGLSLYRHFYGPSAFVERYVSLLAEGSAADALAVPGVRVSSAALEDAGMNPFASQALLRSAALSSIDDIHAISEKTVPEGVEVTVGYRTGDHYGRSTFLVEQDGWIGVAPRWRFAQSPLAVLDLQVSGSMSFTVNGFEIDKRQVAAEGADVDPAATVPLLVFSPGRYRVGVDTPIAQTPGVDVVADVPLVQVPVRVAAEPTEEFIRVVQDEVDAFLDECATQQVLQPTACPFGYVVQNRIVTLPEWSISEYPTVTLEPSGADWVMPPTTAAAHLLVDVRSLFDGTIREVDEDVPFTLDAAISLQPDGSVSIRVGAG